MTIGMAERKKWGATSSECLIGKKTKIGSGADRTNTILMDSLLRTACALGRQLFSIKCARECSHQHNVLASHVVVLSGEEAAFVERATLLDA